MVRFGFEDFFIAFRDVVIEFLEPLFELSICWMRQSFVQQTIIDTILDVVKHVGVTGRGVLTFYDPVLKIFELFELFCYFLSDGGCLMEGVKNILSNYNIIAPGGKIIIALSH